MAPSSHHDLYAVDVRMGEHGYWIVTVSASPWQRFSIMIVRQGITPDEARSLALGASIAALPAG